MLWWAGWPDLDFGTPWYWWRDKHHSSIRYCLICYFHSPHSRIWFTSFLFPLNPFRESGLPFNISLISFQGALCNSLQQFTYIDHFFIGQMWAYFNIMLWLSRCLWAICWSCLIQKVWLRLFSVPLPALPTESNSSWHLEKGVRLH